MWRRQSPTHRGAGDTFVAALAAALACDAKSDPPRQHRGRHFRLQAGNRGGQRPRLGRGDPTPEAGRKRRQGPGIEAAPRQIAEWRRRGLRIGLTNGCFDLIHPGHVHLLAQAQGACDRLAVALNTDASVRRLKGPERPIQHETARATVLSSLASVDLVVLFAGETPLSLIEAIRPDILVKGADYSPDQVVGADIVRRNGGRVLLVDLLPDQGTSATIARVRERAAAAG